jgi:signal transduction histidine kinase
MPKQSISRKFSTTLLPLVAALILATGSVLSWGHGRAIARAIADKAQSQTRLLAKIGCAFVENYNFISLDEIARESLLDPNVVFTTFYDADHKPISKGAPEPPDLLDLAVHEQAIRNTGGETIGFVKMGFRRDAIKAAIASGIQWTAMCLALSVVLTGGVLLLTVRHLTRPAVRAADILRCATTSSRINCQGQDEIAELCNAIDKKTEELEAINERLERLVEERTATIRVILDHVRFGFLLVDPQFQIQEGFSRSCDTLLDGVALAGRNLFDVLGLNGGLRSQFEVMLGQVFEDILPEATTLDQLPTRVPLGKRTLGLEASPIRNPAGVVERVLFTIVDLTDLEKAERENAHNRAFITILRNLPAFHEFVRDSRNRLQNAQAAVETGNQDVTRRELHTLKGNSATYGLLDIAGIIHGIEDAPCITKECLQQITSSIRAFLDDNFDLFRIRLDGRYDQRFEVSSAMVEDLGRRILRSTRDPLVIEAVQAWADEVKKLPALALLGPVEAYAVRLARQRGKEVRVLVRGADMALDPDRMRPLLQNLSHLIRNAVEHGIESPAERHGKPPIPTIAISFALHGDLLLVTVEDDGRGIDTDKVKAKAFALGRISREELDQMTPHEATELVFLDGLSTAEKVTTTSGRGVGMSAIRAAVENLGGRLEVESTPGAGTKLQIDLPIEARGLVTAETVMDEKLGRAPGPG